MVQRINKHSKSIFPTSLGILFFIFIQSSNLFAQHISAGYSQLSFDISTQHICDKIYRYEFKIADSLITQYIKKNPSSMWPNMLHVNLLWWNIMTGNDKNVKLINQFSTELNTILDKYEKVAVLKLSYEELYIISNAYAFKSRLNILQEDYIKGLLNLNKCINFIEQTLGKEEKFEAFLIQSGLLNYFIEYSSINKPLTKPYLATLPKGSIAKGLSLLERGTKSADNIISTECNYFMGKIYSDVEKNYVMAEPYLQYLVKRYPQNIIYNYNYFICSLHQGKKEQTQKAYIAINRLSRSLHGFSVAQRMYYINEAKKQSEIYYKSLSK